jgi:limonene-1,2-epoxide hydrolase
MTNCDVVNAFLVAAAARDYDTALPLVTDDVEYQNMMLPAVHGKDAMVETLEMMQGFCDSSKWAVLKEVAAGDLVMNERVDTFVMKGVATPLPVAGVFTLRDGQIATWHDYFDLQTIMSAMPLDEA